MTPPRIVRVLCLAAALSLTPLALGLTVRPVSVAELTRASDDVVVGTVRRSVSRWEEGFIVTDHEVDVEAALKGRLPTHATIVVRVAGGVVGRIGQQIPGAPTLEGGRTYMLFLSGGVSSVRYLAHMTAAVVPVSVDPAGHVVAMMPDALTPTTPAATSTVTDSHPRGTATPLEQVARGVRAVAP